jgi:protease PrsW
MIVAFLWGGFAATWTMAANANNAILALYVKAFGQAWTLDWGASLAAPFTEETAKGAGLLLLIALAPRHVRTAFDGAILGAFIGLGFQIVEDIEYAMTSAGSQFGANQIGASIDTIMVRMVSGVAPHILYSAIFCAGLIYLLGRPAEPRRVWRGLTFVTTAVALHGIWDSLSSVAGPNMWLLAALAVSVAVVALFSLVRVYELTVPRERDFMRAVMAPEEARHVINAAELDAMVGNRKARRAYRRAAHNRRERRRRGYVLNAAYDLSAEVAAARGADTDRVRFARAEVSRIRAGGPTRW